MAGIVASDVNKDTSGYVLLKQTVLHCFVMSQNAQLFGNASMKAMLQVPKKKLLEGGKKK